MAQGMSVANATTRVLHFILFAFGGLHKGRSLAYSIRHLPGNNPPGTMSQPFAMHAFFTLRRLIALAASAALVTLFATGCSTFHSRSQEKSEVFNALDSQTQQRLKKGEIAIGDTADLVYIALGSPDERRSSITSAGEKLTWIYNVYWQEYAGTVHSGYRRIVIYDPGLKRYLVYFEPVRTDVYHQRVDERIRVELINGRVASVEQTKP